MKHLMIMTFGAALLLGGCATGGGAKDASDSKSVKLDTHKLDVMAGKQQVYIGNVGVTFITEDRSSSKASSPMIRHTPLIKKNCILVYEPLFRHPCSGGKNQCRSAGWIRPRSMACNVASARLLT